MPITLITGLPGHGKTLYALSRYREEAAKANRPVFHNDIKGLNIPNWHSWKLEEWQNLPAGAIMVVDEAQFSFPTRGRGAPDPWVERLTTHRHLGLDFVVITQNPMLLDSYVRRLVDRHFHVVRKFGTHSVTIHEFANGCKENVGTSREGSIRHEWRFPKEVFGLYESAELHTVKRRIPARVWVMLSIPFLAAGLATFIYYRLQPSAVAERVAVQSGVPIPGAEKSFGAVAGGGRDSGGPAGRGDAPLSALEYAQAFVPRVEGLPHTAPVYDSVTQPTSAPYPAACVHMPSKSLCKCYSQQATALDVPVSLCKQIAGGGFFVAWGQPAVSAVPVSEAKPVPVLSVANSFSAAPTFQPVSPIQSADAESATGVRRRLLR